MDGNIRTIGSPSVVKPYCTSHKRQIRLGGNPWLNCANPSLAAANSRKQAAGRLSRNPRLNGANPMSVMPYLSITYLLVG